MFSPMSRIVGQTCNSMLPLMITRNFQPCMRVLECFVGDSTRTFRSSICGAQHNCFSFWSTTAAPAEYKQRRGYSNDLRRRSDVDVTALDGLSYFNRRFGRVPTFEVVEILSKDGTVREYGKPRTAEALGLHPRDVSIFTKDPRLTTQTATITVRDGAIFFKTEAASAIIGATKAILFKNKRERDTIRIRDAILMSINQRTRLPFELCVLEVLLSETVHYFERKANHLSMMMDSLINDFAFDKGVVPAMLDGAQLLQPVQKHLTSVENDVTETYKAINNLLEDESSLSEICLTAHLTVEAASHPPHPPAGPPGSWGPTGSSNSTSNTAASNPQGPAAAPGSPTATSAGSRGVSASPSAARRCALDEPHMSAPACSGSVPYPYSHHRSHDAAHHDSLPHANNTYTTHHDNHQHTQHHADGFYTSYTHDHQHATAFHPRHQLHHQHVAPLPLSPVDRPPDAAADGNPIQATLQGQAGRYPAGTQCYNQPSCSVSTGQSIHAVDRNWAQRSNGLGMTLAGRSEVNKLSPGQIWHHEDRSGRAVTQSGHGCLHLETVPSQAHNVALTQTTRPKLHAHAANPRIKRFGGMCYPLSRALMEENLLDRDIYSSGNLGGAVFSMNSSSSIRHSSPHGGNTDSSGGENVAHAEGGWNMGGQGSGWDSDGGFGNGLFGGGSGLGRARRPPGSHPGGGHVRPKDLLMTHTHLASTMLEAYQREVQSLQGVLGEMDDHLCNTRETWHMQLDAVRNHIILVSLWLSLVNVSVMLAAILPAFLGMNLSSGLPEDSPPVFYAICGASVVLAAASYPLGRRWYLRSFQDLANSQGRQMKSIRLFMMQHIDDVEDIIAACQALPSTTISRQDFRKAIKEGVKGRYISDAAIDFLYRCFDSNKDGLLQQAELVKSHSSHYMHRPCGNGNNSQPVEELDEPPRLTRALRWLYGPPKTSPQPPHHAP